MNILGTVEFSNEKKAIVLLTETIDNNKSENQHRVNCKNYINAEVGNKVELSETKTRNDRAQFNVRLFPLLFVVLGIALSLLTEIEVMRFAIICATALIGFLLTCSIVIILNKKAEVAYTIKNIIKE